MDLKERLFQILNNFHKKKILVIGDIMVDHYVLGNADRLSSEAPVPIVDVRDELLRLGGSANVINNITSLGANVFPIGIIGEDKNGRWVKEEFKQKGIETSGLIVDSDRPTTTKTRVMVGQHQLLRIDFEKRKEIDTTKEKKILKAFKLNIDSVDCIVLVDYDKGVFTSTLIKGISNIALEKKKITVVSPKKNHYLEYKNMTIAKSNIQEAYGAVNVHSTDEASIIEVGRRILKELDCTSFLMTRGKEGMTLFEKREVLSVPTFVKEVFDVTGAGDVVTAALALSIATGSSIKEAAIISNAAAGVKVGKIGTATVNQNELKAQLTSYNHILDCLKCENT